MPAQKSYIVIGAGVFGVSTAYHLIKKYPDASVRLFDRTPYPCPLAASWDCNKVVRADYGDSFYMEKALEAIQFWRSDPIFKPYYHQSGLINIDNTGRGRRMIEGYKKLGMSVDAKLIAPEEFKQLYGGFFQDTDFSDVEEIFVNTESAWAEATKALTAFTDAAVEAGVQYTAAEIKRLTFDDDGSCAGIQTSDGSIIVANHVILCTGAGTAKLLADSAPRRPELQANDRLTAAATIAGLMRLDLSHGRPLSELPVIVHAIETTRGGMVPLTAPSSVDDPYLVKLCWDESYKNTLKHEESGLYFSTPPLDADQGQFMPRQKLKDRLEIVKRGILGAPARDLEISEYRVCWDAVTPNQGFIVASHPHCERLYLATGGSFHGWKFMPTIGRYVVALLDGTLEPALVKRWAWDRDNEGSAHGNLLPTKELRDL